MSHAIKTNPTRFCLPGALVVVFLLASLPVAITVGGAEESQSTEGVRIQGFEPGQLEVRGFELTQPLEISIEAVGYEEEKGWGFWNSGSKPQALTEAWILKSDNRQIVWSTSSSTAKARGHFRDYKDNVRLESGLYEVYFSSLPVPKRETEKQEGSWLEKLGDAMSSDYKNWQEYLSATDKLGITVRGPKKALDPGALEAARALKASHSLVTMHNLGDGERVSLGFELDQPTRLELYAVGEMFPHRDSDRGWIVDLKTRRRVWTMSHEDSTDAGGDRKNRLVQTSLTLGAGRYAASFVTDNSHSTAGWNTLPPHDPLYWGLTVSLVDGSQEQQARAFDYQEFPDDSRVLVALTGLGDDEHRTAGFTLDRALEVRVYALGEGAGPRMADYGKIVFAETDKQMWKMDVNQTEHAGGARKNRVADEIIFLQPGNYLVHYSTDDSHSSERWNAPPPLYPQKWGISLFAVSDDFDPSQVHKYEPEETSTE